MIVIIQCAAKKRPDAGLLRTADGRPVYFVADPSRAPASEGVIFARPDDPSDSGPTWRDILLRYNNESGSNPLGLSRAFELYENPAYKRLATRIGIDRTYILSAGWGLIPASFLTPTYDITFSPSSEPFKRRRRGDAYRDFRMLPEVDEPAVFFGGKDYLSLFCALSEGFKGRKTVFYNSAQRPHAAGCTFERFLTKTRTNWHYECANAFLDGKLDAVLPSQVQS